MAKAPLPVLGLLGKGKVPPPSVPDADEDLDEEAGLRAELQALLDDEELDDEELADAVSDLLDAYG
jgi:hypothetical protein